MVIKAPGTACKHPKKKTGWIHIILTNAFLNQQVYFEKSGISEQIWGYAHFCEKIAMNNNNNKPEAKIKTWTREHNQLAQHSYFWSNLTKRGYRKRMIEIGQECASFQTTSQRLADQIRTIILKNWFSGLEILEMHHKIDNEEDSNTIPDTLSIKKQKQPNWNEPPTSENRNATQPNNAQPNNAQPNNAQPNNPQKR